MQSDHTWASGILKLSGVWEDLDASVTVVVSVKDVWVSWDETVDVRGLSFLPGDCREVPRKFEAEVRPRSNSWAWSEFWWDKLWSNPCLIGALQKGMTVFLGGNRVVGLVDDVTDGSVVDIPWRCRRLGRYLSGESHNILLRSFLFTKCPHNWVHTCHEDPTC